MRDEPNPFPPPPFEGFPPAALAFFRELAKRQDKTWFAARKADYERDVREPMAALIAELSDRLLARGLPLRGDPKRAQFRINRDVRFSNDKSPYKTHAGAVLTRDGEKQGPGSGVLYIHIDPTGCFGAAGFYAPEPPAMHNFRERVVTRPEEWQAIVAALGSKKLAFSHDDILTRLPKGFESTGNEALDTALKLKSWIVRRPLTDRDIQSSKLVDKLESFAVCAEPLLRFGWSAVTGAVKR